MPIGMFGHISFTYEVKYKQGKTFDKTIPQNSSQGHYPKQGMSTPYQFHQCAITSKSQPFLDHKM